VQEVFYRSDAIPVVYDYYRYCIVYDDFSSVFLTTTWCAQNYIEAQFGGIHLNALICYQGDSTEFHRETVVRKEVKDPEKNRMSA